MGAELRRSSRTQPLGSPWSWFAQLHVANRSFHSETTMRPSRASRDTAGTSTLVSVGAIGLPTSWRRGRILTTQKSASA